CRGCPAGLCLPRPRTAADRLRTDATGEPAIRGGRQAPGDVPRSWHSGRLSSLYTTAQSGGCRPTEPQHPGAAGTTLPDRRESSDRGLGIAMKTGKPPQAAPGGRISRRELLLAAAAGSLGVGGVHESAAAAGGSTDEVVDLTRSYPFYGHAEQAGIRTPPQRYVFYMTFD